MHVCDVCVWVCVRARVCVCENTDIIKMTVDLLLFFQSGLCAIMYIFQA